MLNKFEEIKFLLERADEHLKWLREQVVHPNPNRSADKTGYYITPESGEIFAAQVRIVIGECASCMRNALNYATTIVSEQDSKAEFHSVQFPIESCPQNFAANRPRYLKGVADEHLAFFERLQPYNTGEIFALIREFSNAYRHRGLIRVDKKFERPEEFTSPPKTHTHGPIKVEVQRGFTVAISLEDGRPVVETLEKMLLRVRQIIDEFKTPLARWLSFNS